MSDYAVIYVAVTYNVLPELIVEIGRILIVPLAIIEPTDELPPRNPNAIGATSLGNAPIAYSFPLVIWVFALNEM